MTNANLPDLPDQVQKKLSKRLALALGISCFVNVSLLAFGLYEWQEGGYSFLVNCPFRPQKAKKDQILVKNLPTLTQAFREFELLSYDELISQLANAEPVCEGYRKQDIALSLLAMNHFFDLQRALGSQAVLQKRQFRYVGKDNLPSEIILYPALSDEHFVKVCTFASTEKYPMTAEGMFEKLKLCKEQDLKDEELRYAFIMTDEYRTADILLRRGTQLSNERVFEFVQSCEWNMLKELYNEMRARQSFTPEVRRAFLVKALPQASSILLETDPRFALHSLSDPQILSILGSATLTLEQRKSFSLAILESPRSDAVWNKAKDVFCDASLLDATQETRGSILQRSGKKIASKGITMPKPEARPLSETSLSKPKSIAKAPVAAVKTANKSALKPTKVREIVYTVKTGDTLWHLAKRYKVDVERIKKRNNLKSDALKPGSVLYIPEPATSVTR